jgi:hypothetical protein
VDSLIVDSPAALQQLRWRGEGVRRHCCPWHRKPARLFQKADAFSSFTAPR